MSDQVAMNSKIANGMDGMINEILAENGGGVVVGFTAFIQYMDNEGERRWSFITEKGQTLMTSCGHVDYLHAIVNRELQAAVRESDR